MSFSDKKVLGFILVCLQLAEPRLIEAEKSIENRRLFESFRKEYDKVYEDESEFRKRFETFTENLEMMEILQERERGTAVYGVTEFSDLTSYEFQRIMGPRKPRKPEEFGQRVNFTSEGIPKAFDWRQHEAVTSVKNQGCCGSSWAFSVAGNIEGQLAIKRNKLISLSAQQIIDCDTFDAGCVAGTTLGAYKYVAEAGGLEKDSDYPYAARKRKCRFDQSKIAARISNFLVLPQNEILIADWLYKYGPVSAVVRCSIILKFYKSGILHPHPCPCFPFDFDQNVLIVGYGEEKSSGNRNIPYWIIKNSWGPKWGENGYFRLFRGDGTCGIDRHASTAFMPREK